VISVLDSGAEGPGFKSQPRLCRVTLLSKLFTPIVPLFTKQQKMVAALLRVVRATAGLAKSNGSLPPGLWLTSPAGWLPRTGISSRTTRSVIEYGLPLPLHAQNGGCLYLFLGDLCRYSGPVTADRLIVVQLDSDNATLATLDFTKLNHVTGDMQVRHSHTGTQPHIDQRPANHLHQQ